MIATWALSFQYRLGPLNAINSWMVMVIMMIRRQRVMMRKMMITLMLMLRMTWNTLKITGKWLWATAE